MSNYIWGKMAPGQCKVRCIFGSSAPSAYNIVDGDSATPQNTGRGAVFLECIARMY